MYVFDEQAEHKRAQIMHRIKHNFFILPYIYKSLPYIPIFATAFAGNSKSCFNFSLHKKYLFVGD